MVVVLLSFRTKPWHSNDEDKNYSEIFVNKVINIRTPSYQKNQKESVARLLIRRTGCLPGRDHPRLSIDQDHRFQLLRCGYLRAVRDELLHPDHTACLRRYSPKSYYSPASDELFHAIRSGLCQRADSSNIEVHWCRSVKFKPEIHIIATQ